MISLQDSYFGRSGFQFVQFQIYRMLFVEDVFYYVLLKSFKTSRLVRSQLYSESLQFLMSSLEVNSDDHNKWLKFSFIYQCEDYGVAVKRSNFSGRKDRCRTFWSNFRDRMECGRILSYLLYGSVASIPSPSSNIEAYGTSLLHSGH